MTVEVQVRAVEDFFKTLVDDHPRLLEANSRLVIRLAETYRLLDFHTQTLDIEPGNRYSTDQFTKLSKLAENIEGALAPFMTGTDPAHNNSVTPKRGRENV